uniref:Uncharacterized protein n=1 Tax=Oryza punctata TaxID=4537 RepID=A0A0E0LH29_ORYPU
MAYRSMLHKRILPAAAGAALRRSAAGSRLFQARQQQGNGRQHSSSSSISEFLGADFRRARGNDLRREMEQLLQTAEENSKRWSQEWEELDKLRRYTSS